MRWGYLPCSCASWPPLPGRCPMRERERGGAYRPSAREAEGERFFVCCQKERHPGHHEFIRGGPGASIPERRRPAEVSGVVLPSTSEADVSPTPRSTKISITDSIRDFKDMHLFLCPFPLGCCRDPSLLGLYEHGLSRVSCHLIPHREGAKLCVGEIG